MSKPFLRFTDEEGDPLALTNEIAAVFVATDTETLKSFPGREVKRTVGPQLRGILHVTGQYKVQDSFEEIMEQIKMADACE